MLRTLADFAGTWTILAGRHQGLDMKIEEVGDQTFWLHLPNDPSVRPLTPDLDSFTLNTPTNLHCLALWKDPAYLMGATVESTPGRNTFDVWGAQRSTPNPAQSEQRPEGEPNWRFGEAWTVQVRHPDLPDDSDQPSPPPGTEIELRQLTRSEILLVDRDQDQIVDTLTPNPPNRSLDGAFRCLALWRALPGRNRLFAMYLPEAAHTRAARRAFVAAFGDAAGWRASLRRDGWQPSLDAYRALVDTEGLPRLLGVEVAALFAGFAASGARQHDDDLAPDPIVWGAEEGGS